MALDELFRYNREQANGTGRIRLVQVAAPAVDVLTIDELKETLRIQNARHDAQLTRILRASRATVEELSGVALINQTWKETRDYLTNPVSLVVEPVASITSVKYYATDESTTLTTIDSARYYQAGQELVHRSTWPGARSIQGYEITYVAGFGTTANEVRTAAGNAANLVQAVEIIATYLFENPGDLVQLEATGASDRSNLRSLPPEAMAMIRSKARFLL